MYAGQDCNSLSSAVAERLVGLIGRRVAIPVMPLPGEALADLIFRAASANGYKTVWELFGERGSFSHSAFAINQPDVRGLADLLGTPTGDEDLAPLRYPKLSGSPVKCDFFGACLPGRHFIGWRRVSPLALRDAPHSKAIWHLTAINFDPSNYERLLDKCPACDTKLNFRDTRGVCHCHKCGPSIDFRDFEQPKVEVEDNEALDFMTGLVDPMRPQGKAAVSLLHPDLCQENPGHVFTLGVLVAAALDNRQKASGRRVLSSAEVSASSLATAGRALLNWPDGLAQILSSRTLFRSATEAGEAHSFAILCKHGGTLNSSLMDAVQKVVMLSRLGEKQPRCFRRLQVAKESLAHGNELEIASFTAAAGSGPFLKAVAATKLPPIVLYNCYLNGLCGAAEGQEERIGDKILSWSAKLTLPDIPVIHDIKKAVSLQKCVNILYRGRGDIWPLVLAEVMKGNLPCKRAAMLADWIESLFITDFEPWRAFLGSSKGIKDCSRFPLTSPEVAFYLNMSLGATQTMFDFNQIITSDYLYEFTRDYIFVDDLSELTAMKGERQTRDYLFRRLNDAGLRANGDRAVRRHECLSYLGLCEVAGKSSSENVNTGGARFDVSRLHFKWSDVQSPKNR